MVPLDSFTCAVSDVGLLPIGTTTIYKLAYFLGVEIAEVQQRLSDSRPLSRVGRLMRSITVTGHDAVCDAAHMAHALFLIDEHGAAMAPSLTNTTLVGLTHKLCIAAIEGGSLGQVA